MSLRNIAKMVSEASKEKTPEQEFLQSLNRTIVNMQTKRKPSKTIKPSSLGGCKRNIYFQLIGAEIDKESTITAEVIGMGESGTDRHERLQAAIIQMPEVEWVDVEEYLKARPELGTVVQKKVGYEYKLYNEALNLSCLCDGIIKFKGKYYILEIKTEASFKWNNRYAPEEKHKVQATAYAIALGIKDVIFLYENRDVCGKKTFLYKVSDDEIETLVTEIYEIIDMAESGEVPPKSDDKRECNYCQYKEECKKW